MSTPLLDIDLLSESASSISDEIEALDNTRAPLFAVYGPGGTWEAERKAMLCACAVLIRERYTGSKVTEAQIDQEAHRHPSYQDRIDQAADERTKMALLDAEIAAKTRKYELAKSRIYTLGKLAGLQ